MTSHNSVTFTLTLPVAGTFEETVAALRAARDSRNNPDAAQALHTVILLAEGGLSLIASGAAPVILIGAKR